MSCAIFSLDLSNGRCKTMGTTSDILHYHSTFDDTWSLYQYYTESDYLRECEPSVHSICLLDGTSDQAKVSTNFQIASRPPQDLNILAVLDFQIPCSRHEILGFYLRKFAHQARRPWAKTRTSAMTSTSWGVLFVSL